MLNGLIFHIQRYSIHDGPGIRTTVFLKGCLLRCQWCHNPESLRLEPELMIRDQRCSHCGSCWQSCPQTAQRGGASGGPAGFLDGSVVEPWSDPDRCTCCGQCVEVCEYGAREVVGRWMTVDQTLAEIRKDRIFFEDSGGGVTLSGGEPLLQADFVRELLAACRTDGISTAVDTSGYGDPSDLRAVAEFTDLFLFDVKHLDDEEHRRQTGVSNQIILRNLNELARLDVPIWIRVPLIAGFNDCYQNLESTARLAASLPTVTRVNLLPCHQLAVHKRVSLGRLTDTWSARAPAAEVLDQALSIFRSFGLNVQIGG
jgi:pyruvate formate lyase activating enzyme